MRSLYLLATIFVVNLSLAQEVSFQALLLDKTLTENADAIIRLDKTDVTLHSYDRMTVHKRFVVTILRKAGGHAIVNYAHYNAGSKLDDLQALVYNSSGKQIEKIKKKDFKDVSAVSGVSLYEDSRVKYFNYTPISYPYTIDFEYSYDTSNTAFMPRWTPVDDYRVSIEKSEYHLSNPGGIKVRKLQKNFEGYPIENTSTDNDIMYQLSSLPALKKESLEPSFMQSKPCLLVGLDKFQLAGFDGTGKDWNSLGKWQYDNLLIDKDKLSPNTVAKIGDMVSGIEDPIEKAKIIYKYVQENTRYISVQLGIGGWMPISADEVDRVKYGDCKGLTNYTKALLKSQGIESFYSVVYAGKGKRNIEKEFASMQGNHVILNIPNNGKDVWLECTSQTIPFGFLGNFTDDRDVLVITPEGGVIKHTPIYSDDDNKKITKASIVLDQQGNITADVAITSRGITYKGRSALERLPKEKKDKHYKEYWGNINGLTIAEMKSANNSGSVEYVENVKIEAQSYASIAGNDMLLKLNAFDASDFVPDRYRNRKQPFEIARSFENEDFYTIAIPDSYSLSNLPDPIKLDSKFGSYSVNISKNENDQLLYERKLLIKKGKYSKDEYEDYRNFRKKVAKNDNLKIVLTK